MIPPVLPLIVLLLLLSCPGAARADTGKISPATSSPGVAVEQPLRVPEGRLALAVAAREAPRRSARVGWGRGERMTFAVSLAGIRGGRAAIGVGRPRVKGGRRELSIRALGETVPFISTIRRMREDQVTTLDLDGLGPLRSVADREVPDKDRSLETEFSNEHQVIQVLKAEGKVLRRVRRIPSPHLDSISALYLLRSAPLQQGQRFELRVVNGTGLLMVAVQVAGDERIYVGGKPYTALRLDGVGTPSFDDGKPIPGKPARRLTLWLSADARRVPLRAEGDTSIGMVRADLTSYTPPKRPLTVRVAGL